MPRSFAKWIKSIWSILDDCANSFALFRASETVINPFTSDISSLVFTENLLSLSGTVAATSARSVTERVAFCPGHFLAHVSTKSSTIFFPISIVGMLVFSESLLSQFV